MACCPCVLARIPTFNSTSEPEDLNFYPDMPRTIVGIVTSPLIAIVLLCVGNARRSSAPFRPTRLVPAGLFSGAEARDRFFETATSLNETERATSRTPSMRGRLRRAIGTSRIDASGVPARHGPGNLDAPVRADLPRPWELPTVASGGCESRNLAAEPESYGLRHWQGGDKGCPFFDRSGFVPQGGSGLPQLCLEQSELAQLLLQFGGRGPRQDFRVFPLVRRI